MDTAEFNRLVEQTVRELAPRIPAEYRDGFAGGEHWMAVHDLIFALADASEPVTAGRRERLRLLAREAGGDAEVLAALEQLAVDDRHEGA